MPFPALLQRGVAAAVSVLALAAFLGGCASRDKKTSSGDDVQKLYADARDELASSNYEQAIKALEKLESRATGTLLGQQALLELAHAHWRAGERVLALATLDRFAKQHPSSPASDYALYLRGLVNFNDSLGLLSGLARQNLSERDQQASRDAYQAFSQLVQRYPESRYAADARVRMDFILNSLADYEVHVARYYLRRGAHLAAANRAQQAVIDFEGAPAAEEALSIMVQSYDRLGLITLRDDARRVLKRNFPSSRFLDSAERASAPASASAPTPAASAEIPSRPWWRFW